MNLRDASRAQMIEVNMGLVHACAHRMTGRGAEYDDLFQAGCVGLIKAVDGFDPARGFSFSTYAVPVILGEIKRIFRDGGSIKVSRTIKENGRKIARERERFIKRYGRDPRISELAELTGLSEEDTALAVNAMIPPASLTESDDDSKSGELDIPTLSPEDEVSTRIAVGQVLSDMDERDGALIRLRYFEGLTQCATAERLGMSQVQVSRREKKLLLEMREKLM